MTPVKVKIKSALLKVGISVNDIWDLVNRRERYPEAIPVLIELLSTEIMDDRTKEGIVRSLAVKEAKGKTGKILFYEFNNTPRENWNLRWAIGNTIEVVLTKDDLEDILEIVTNKENGMARQMLVSGLAKIKTERTEDVLVYLLEDDDVVLHALSALRRLKSVKAIDKIRKLQYHPSSTVRNRAKKYLDKYDN